MIGSFVKIFEVTKAARYISYTRICVYMNVVNSLLESIVVSYQDEEWIQPLDYENIPFHVGSVMLMVHLFRYFPLNSPNPRSKSKEEIYQEGLYQDPKQKEGWKTPT
jgi:hypothetical protein